MLAKVVSKANQLSYPTPGIISKTRAVATISQAMSPDYLSLLIPYFSHACGTTGEVAHLVEDVQVLKQGIASSGHGSIVWVVNGVVEIAQLGTIAINRHGDGPLAVEVEGDAFLFE